MSAGTEGAPQPLDGLALLRLARRIGIAYKQAEDPRDRYDAVKAGAAEPFADIRRRGISSVEIRLPDGTKVALITIERGPENWTWDEDELTLAAAINDPRDFEQVIQPRAWADPRVTALVAEHFPEYTTRQLRPAAAADYRKEAQENGGRVINRKNGEYVTVGTCERMRPTGKYSVRWTSKGRLLLQDAIDSGALNLDGTAAGDDSGDALDGLTTVDPEDAAAAVAAGTARYFDADGLFLSPEAAAAHAIEVQGGHSTPELEARRMAAGDGPLAEMGRQWLADAGLPFAGGKEPDGGDSA